jgi:hypothetical protein
MTQQQLLQWLPMLLVVGLVIYRNSRPQTMNEVRFWIPPLLIILLTGFMFFGTVEVTPGAMTYALVASLVGIVLGVPLGIARGHHSQVRLADKQGHFIVDPSLIVLLIWLGAFGARFAIRYFMPGAGDLTTGVSDGLVVFAVASVITARVVIFRKYLNMKAEAAA